mgnify:CR=1 FL=1
MQDSVREMCAYETKRAPRTNKKKGAFARLSGSSGAVPRAASNNAQTARDCARNDQQRKRPALLRKGLPQL